MADRDGLICHALVDRDAIALVGRVEDGLDVALHALRRDVVLDIVARLLLAAAVGFGDRAGHRAGHLVGIEDDAAIDIAGGTADRLHQRGLRPQEALLVGIENGDQRAFRDVEALAQQVDADEHVEGAEAQVADDLDPLQSVDIRMHVAHADAVLVEVLRQVLGHALGQHGDERAIAGAGDIAHLAEEVVDLRPGRADDDLGVDQPGRADDLFREDAAGAVHLPVPRRGRDMHGLRPHRVPFLEAQRPVVEAGGQAEAVFGKRGLAPEVALVHRADLRNRDMALIGEDQGIVREIFEQSRRRLAWLAPGEIARVILDALADAGRLQHFEIELRALLQPLRLDEPALVVELVEPLLQFGLDALDGLIQRRARCHVMRIRIDLDEFQVGILVPGQRIELDDGLDLVAEQADPPGAIFQMRREQFDDIATDAEGAA